MTDLAARLTPERERIRAQVRSTRRSQGLAAHVTDLGVLDRLAARVLVDARPEHNGGPGTRRGRRLTTPPLPTKEGRGDGTP
jgi:hypothetical protein